MPMWCVVPLEMNEGNSLGQGYNRPTGCSAEKARHATFLTLTSQACTWCHQIFSGLNLLLHSNYTQLICLVPFSVVFLTVNSAIAPPFRAFGGICCWTFGYHVPQVSLNHGNVINSPSL